MKRESFRWVWVAGLGVLGVGVAACFFPFTADPAPSVLAGGHPLPLIDAGTGGRGVVVAGAALPAARSDDWAVRWSAYQKGERTPERVKAMTELLAALAVLDPQRALAWAEAEGDAEARAVFFNVALRGWSIVDAGAAEAWVAVRPADTRWILLQSVIAGLVTVDPDAAVGLVARSTTRDPGQAGDFGRSLIEALGARGDFAAAARFACADPAHQEWRDLAFYAWARNEPRQALAGAQALSDLEERAQALRTVRLGWAQAEPVALVAYAMSLPPGEERAEGVTTALPQWVNRDPVAASAWVASLEPTAEFDAGAAIIAAAPGLVAEQPSAAFKWAASIAHAELRRELLGAVAGEWAAADPVAVRRFLAATGDLSSEETAALRAALAAPAANPAGAGVVLRQ